MDPLNVLVTGGAGYIGSHTAKALAAAGHRPVVLDDLSAGHREAVRWGPFVQGGIGDRAALEVVLREHRIDAVIHFAAHAYVGESMSDPAKYFRNNVAGTLSLLEAMKACDVHTIVFSSSCATYGIPDQLPISETTPQAPINPYGESKLVCERFLRWFGECHDFEWMALRYFNAAGADPDGEIGEDHDPETHLIPLVISAALGFRPDVKVFGTDYPTDDGTAVRDFVHVTDLAEAHVRALEHLRSGGASAALNLGTGRGWSVREVVDAVARVTGMPVPVTDSPRRAGDPPVLIADVSLAAQQLGWRARFTGIDEIVATAVRWQRRLGR
jgi:UDP-arabinose 4-epimerase